MWLAWLLLGVALAQLPGLVAQVQQVLPAGTLLMYALVACAMLLLLRRAVLLSFGLRHSRLAAKEEECVMPHILERHRSIILGSHPEKGIPRELRTLRLPLNELSELSADAIAGATKEAVSPLFPRKFDLVCSGGGLCAFYGGMVSSVLGSLKRRGVLSVDKLYGVSSGALVCACYLGCECGFTKPVDIYRCYQIFVQGTWLSISMRQFLDEVLPPDVHERASGRMHVTVLEFRRDRLLPRQRNISWWATRDDFLDTIMASTVIPHVTFPHFFRPASEPDTAWMDGAFVNAPPPTLASPQLRIEQMAVAERLHYPKKWLVQTTDDNFDVTLGVAALKDIARLMAHGDTLRNGAMEFLPAGMSST